MSLGVNFLDVLFNILPEKSKFIFMIGIYLTKSPKANKNTDAK